jgi:hypothetical protein
MIVFINQIRMKIGVMFGNPETTTGGNALKFYASVRLDIRRIGAIKDRDEVVGNRTRVKVVKNKLAPPFKMVEFDILYGEGISKAGELLDFGVDAGIVEKSGSWFSYDGQRIGQGRENARTFLKEHPDSARAIETALLRDLAWLGLDWRGLFRQSDRADLYRSAADRLKAAGRLYPCYETPDELDFMRRRQRARGRPPIYDRAALKLSAEDVARLEAEGRRPHWRFLLEESTVAWEDMVRGRAAHTGTSRRRGRTG